MGRGAWRLDEELRSLTLQTDKTIRLIKLGTIDRAASNDEVTIGVDCFCQSSNGRFGVFWGFHTTADDHSRNAHFLAVEVFGLSDPQSKRRAVIRRYIATLNERSGTVRSDGYRDTGIFEAKLDRENWRLDVRFSGASPFSVQFCGQTFPELCSDESNLEYSTVDFLGDFGLYSLDGSVWYSNPVFQRNSGIPNLHK